MKFSLVSYLDDVATKEVRRMQRELSELTGAQAALISWQPHVTVGDGIEVTDDQRLRLESELSRFCMNEQTFTLEMDGFGTFDTRPVGRSETSTPYVIYLHVVSSRALLRLVERLADITDTYDKWYEMVTPYTPHVTLAFRDLDETGFKKGCDYIAHKSGQITSAIATISLVERSEAGDIEYRRFAFADAEM